MKRNMNVYCLDLSHNNGEREFRLVMAKTAERAIEYLYTKLPPWMYIYHVEKLSEDKVSVYSMHYPIETAN